MVKETEAVEPALPRDDIAPLRPRRVPAWLVVSALPREIRLLAWGAVLVVIVLVLTIALTPPRPLTLVAASVRAETLRLTIFNPDEASFRLASARVDDAGRVTCVKDAIFRPEQNATVTYTREVGGPLIVRVEGRSSWRNRTALLGKAPRGVLIRVDPADKACFTPGRVRLPIAGALTIGLLSASDATGETSLPVLSGQLTIYGRAVSSVLGFPLARLERLTLVEPQSLYLAESISLPPGSQIGRAFAANGGRSASRDARWWGFVDADMTPAGAFERGLLIEASTNASALELMPPAPRVTVSETSNVVETGPARTDVISLTLGAQLAGDPNLRWLFAIAGGFIAVIGVAANVVAIFLPMQRSARPTGDSPPVGVPNA